MAEPWEEETPQDRLAAALARMMERAEADAEAAKKEGGPPLPLFSFQPRSDEQLAIPTVCRLAEALIVGPAPVPDAAACADTAWAIYRAIAERAAPADAAPVVARTLADIEIGAQCDHDWQPGPVTIQGPTEQCARCHHFREPPPLSDARD